MTPRIHLADAGYKGLFGDFVQAAKPHTEADPAAVLLTVIARFGAAVGTKPHMMVGMVRHPARDWVALVGPTADGRKGESWQVVDHVFAGVDQGQVASGLSSGEGLIWHVRDAGKGPDGKPDEGVADKRLLVKESELHRVFQAAKRQGSTLSSTARDAWDFTPLQTMTKKEPIRSTNSHIVIVAHSNVEEAVEGMRAIDASNGFGNRFIWGAVRRSQELPVPPRFPEPERGRLREWLDSAIADAKEIGEVRLSPGAEREWRVEYSRLTQGGDGKVSGLLARGAPHVLRIAMIYALADGSATIEVKHLEAGLAVWDFSEASVRAIFGNPSATMSPDEFKLFNFIRERGPCSIAAVTVLKDQRPRRNEVLGQLEEKGLLRRVREHTDGRPREMWEALS